MSAITLQKPLRRERFARDAYYTPLDFARAGLALVDGTPQRVLDPGAGQGVWGEAAVERWPHAWLVGVEIDPALPACVREGGRRVYDEWVVADYLTAPGFEPFDLILGNPPYAQAEAFIRRSLAQLNYGGVCVFLLRLAYLESQRRGEGLFKEHQPEVVSICQRRPRFYGIKGNGGTAFAFVKWRKDYRGETRLTWSKT